MESKKDVALEAKFDDYLKLLAKRREEQPDKANFLIYGRAGSGKTTLIETMPGPVLVHSFDPGGCRGLRKQVEAGRVFVDDRFEFETGEKDTGRRAYKLWEATFNDLVKSGAFSRFGTYVIDSGTRFAQAVLNEVCKQEKRDYAVVWQSDYGKQQIFLMDCLAEICAIPCNFVMTGHIELTKDDLAGAVYFSIMSNGKLKSKIPTMFDEFYLMDVKDGPKGVTRELVTAIDGKIEARTRIGRNVFAEREAPNIQQLLKKAGLPYQDKPLFT